MIRVWGGHGVKDLQDRISKERELFSERVITSAFEFLIEHESVNA